MPSGPTSGMPVTGTREPAVESSEGATSGARGPGECQPAAQPGWTPAGTRRGAGPGRPDGPGVSLRRHTPPTNSVERAIVGVSNYGSYGVELFFILSGFLITGILYDIRDKPALLPQLLHAAGPAHLPALLRRAGSRLLRRPAGPAAAGADAGLPGGPPSVGVALRRQHLHRQQGEWSFSYLEHFWSLAVEEHFYFFWPLVVFLLARRPQALIAASLVTSLCASLARLIGFSWG